MSRVKSYRDFSNHEESGQTKVEDEYGLTSTSTTTTSRPLSGDLILLYAVNDETSEEWNNCATFLYVGDGTRSSFYLGGLRSAPMPPRNNEDITFHCCPIVGKSNIRILSAAVAVVFRYVVIYAFLLKF